MSISVESFCNCLSTGRQQPCHGKTHSLSCVTFAYCHKANVLTLLHPSYASLAALTARFTSLLPELPNLCKTFPVDGSKLSTSLNLSTGSHRLFSTKLKGPLMTVEIGRCILTALPTWRATRRVERERIICGRQCDQAAKRPKWARAVKFTHVFVYVWPSNAWRNIRSKITSLTLLLFFYFVRTHCNGFANMHAISLSCQFLVSIKTNLIE